MRAWVAVALTAVVAVIGSVVWLGVRSPDSYTISAQFVSATGIYPDDEVTILGVPVGRVESLTPTPGAVTVSLTIDGGVRIPSAAKAALVAQSLVAGRTVQLTPAYTEGPTLAAGASIPLQRTVVPMEWDDIKNALSDITGEIGSKGPDDPGSAASLVTTGAEVLDPNADQVNSTITRLAKAITVVSDGRDDLFGVVRNLQVFVTAMAGSNSQVEALQQRLATVAQVLGDNRSDVGGALSTLDTVMADVQTFVTENRDKITSNVATATDVSSTLARQRANIEGLLHQAPTQLSNFYNIYKPAVGGMTGVFSAPNFENPVQAVCGAVAAQGQPTSARGADLCAQYLGGYLGMLTTSYPNILTSPTRSNYADPDQIVSSEPGLATRVPGLAGPPQPRQRVPDTLAKLLLPGSAR